MWNKFLASTLPAQGSALAAKWDTLYWFLTAISVFFFFLIVGGMIYFAIKYRHKKGTPETTTYITGHHKLEAVWITIPTILVLVIFAWGYKLYVNMIEAPENAYEIHVQAEKWVWEFHYKNGRKTIGDLFVPLNKPVKLIMTSEDVIHSFFVPDFRVKQDVVPGMYTSVWFQAEAPGKHEIFCAEYCGTSHSGMLGQVIVLDDAKWADFEQGKEIAQSDKPVSMQDQGAELFRKRSCAACHSLDGTRRVGPTLKGLFNADVPLADGTTVKADENYLRESIEVPTAKIVQGFAPSMPSYKGQLTDAEMTALLTYLKSLK